MLASTYVLRPSQMSMSLISNEKTYVRGSWCLEVRGLEVQRFRGSEVLSSRWFDIQTSKCYREFALFNRRLALMYNGRVEARMREWEYWNSLIYQKWKGENWDEDMKTNSEFKRTKTEWWRQMKTEMWSGFSKVIWSSESNSNASEGLGGTWSLGFWLA